MSKKFKILYEFAIEREEGVEETRINEDNSKTITSIKKQVPIVFALKRPNMNDYDDAELFFAKTVAEGVNHGLLQYSLLDKRFKDNGGFLSKAEQEEKVILHKSYIELAAEKVAKEAEENKDEEKLAELKKKMEEIINTLGNYSIYENSQYNLTAENRARNKTAIWWLLALLHKKEGENYKQLFGGQEHKERYSKYSDLEDLEGEEKLFMDKVLQKAILATSYWYANGAVSEEELEALNKV